MGRERRASSPLAPCPCHCYVAPVFGFGSLEIAVVVVLAILLFPPRELPKMARTFARAYGQFRRTTDELRRAVMLDDELRKPLDEIRSAYDEARFDLRRSTARIESELRDATRIENPLAAPGPSKQASQQKVGAQPTTLGAGVLPVVPVADAEPTVVEAKQEESSSTAAAVLPPPYKLGPPPGTLGRGEGQLDQLDSAPVTSSPGLEENS